MEWKGSHTGGWGQNNYRRRSRGKQGVFEKMETTGVQIKSVFPISSALIRAENDLMALQGVD